MSGGQALSFAQAMRAAMAQELERDASVFAYGEGINDPAGFFGTTVGLRDRFGDDRCFDVPNCEESLVGFGLGAALGGLRPVFVNLRMEFLLLAVNQLVNHVAKWGAMQGRNPAVPLTIRAMVGRGWGQGAQHSGSYAAMLAHVPGLQVAVASGPVEGAGLLVSAVRGDRPTLLIEPKAVFDDVAGVPDVIAPVEIGRAFVRRPGDDFTLVAVGDAVGTCLQVAELLAGRGVAAEVIDACSFAPLDVRTILESVTKTGRIGVVDIGWASYGLAAEVARRLLEAPLVALRSPLLSWAPAGHAPAGCFAESRHYPSVQGIADDIAGAVDRRAGGG